MKEAAKKTLGYSEHKPAGESGGHEVHVKKVHGGYHVTHKNHHNPEHEGEHVVPNKAALMDHMEQHIQDEQEEEAGESPEVQAAEAKQGIQ